MTAARTLNRLPAAERIPHHTMKAAQAAADRIRRRRAEAGDPDLAFFPPSLSDDDDLAAVVAYTRQHFRARDEVRRAELPDRAIVAEYLYQRATERYERDVLAVLDSGHQLHASPTSYGRPFGLTNRQAVWNRRHRLGIRYRGHGIAPATSREKREAERVTAWLTGHIQALREAAGMLVDHRETLLRLVADPDDRDQLGDAIDQAGEAMAGRPTASLAAAIAYAVFFLQSAEPTDPVVRDGLASARRLRDSYRQATKPSG